MKKFIISTPGRTASTSLFNYIRRSLTETSCSITAVDRGQYSKEEWDGFNNSECAAFTTFNPFNFPNILKTIDPSEWCLILLSRNDIASWMLSMNALHATNVWHPGKDYKVESLTFEKDAFMVTYWSYKCWQRMVYDQAENFNFNTVIKIDFEELTTNWADIGQRINDWSWSYDKKLMEMGMTTSWSAVTNLEEVLTWIPEDSIIQQIRQTI